MVISISSHGAIGIFEDFQNNFFLNINIEIQGTLAMIASNKYYRRFAIAKLFAMPCFKKKNDVVTGYNYPFHLILIS